MQLVNMGEYLRQHERMTLADREPEERLHHDVSSNPEVRQLVLAT
jgi:hypothetical protein